MHEQGTGPAQADVALVYEVALVCQELLRCRPQLRASGEMIHYKSQSSMRSFYSLIFISLGSAVYSVQCLFHACLAAGIAVAVSETLEREELDKLTRHPSVYFNGFGSCLSFLLVFRANLSYQRYWEAATRITQLISKLRDVAIQVATFVQSNDEDAASWKSTQLRRLALYNALVLMDLRGGANLDQFVKEGILTEDEKPVLQATGDKASLVMVWLTDGWVVREVRTFRATCATPLSRDHAHALACADGARDQRAPASPVASVSTFVGGVPRAAPDPQDPGHTISVSVRPGVLADAAHLVPDAAGSPIYVH